MAISMFLRKKMVHLQNSDVLTTTRPFTFQDHWVDLEVSHLFILFFLLHSVIYLLEEGELEVLPIYAFRHKFVLV